MDRTICCDKNQIADGSHKNSNRQKHNDIINAGYKILPLPLPFGDYCLLNNTMLETIKRRGEKIKKQDLVADYKVVIDTKKDFQELVGNVCQQHERFRDELIMAQKMGCKMYILVEEIGIKSVADVGTWQNPRLKKWQFVEEKQKQGKMLNAKHRKRPPMSGEILAKVMQTMENKYGCKFVFCSREESGKKIIELLNRQ